MTPVLVDSNVVLDVAAGDPNWSDRSSAALLRAMDEAALVINPLIYAEVSVGSLGDRLAGGAGLQALGVGEGPRESWRFSASSRSSSAIVWTCWMVLVKLVWMRIVLISETIKSGGFSRAMA